MNNCRKTYDKVHHPDEIPVMIPDKTIIVLFLKDFLIFQDFVLWITRKSVTISTIMYENE